MRALTAATGLVVLGYGGWLLVSREDQLVDVAIWLVAGVLLHDGALAVLTLALGALAVRLVPVAARAPVAVGFVVLGPATLLAIPVLGRFGARADNPTLLDRDYTAGWLVLAATTTVAVVAAALVRSRRRPGGR